MSRPKKARMNTPAPHPGQKTARRARRPTYILRLYVNKSTVKSRLAIKNIKRICAEYLQGVYDLKVIDIHKHASLARDEQIVAVPTLIKRLPVPLQRLVGDMSDLNRVLIGLDLNVKEQ